MAPPASSDGRLALASLGTVMAGSALLVLLFLAGPRPGFDDFVVAAIWFGGVLVAAVFPLPLLWWGERAGYGAAAATGAFALVGSVFVPVWSATEARIALLLILVPMALASLGLLFIGVRRWSAGL